MRVGSAEAKDIQVTVMDLSAISKAIGAELEGIVGYDFMKDYRVLSIIDDKRYPLKKHKSSLIQCLNG